MSGVKHRIERLCAQLDTSPDRVDMTSQSPHDVSGVLKRFLSQLPEPLMKFNLYSSFLQIGKVMTSLPRVTSLLMTSFMLVIRTIRS